MSAAASSAPAPPTASASHQVTRARRPVTSSTRVARLTPGTGATCSSFTVSVASVSGVAAPGIFSAKVLTFAVAWAVRAPGAPAVSRCQLNRVRPELEVTLICATVGSSVSGCSRRTTPSASPARTAPAMASAPRAALLRARAVSSGSSRSRAAFSASPLRERASAAWRIMNSAATATAASSTTRKLAMAYLSLKLAAVTCVVARADPPIIGPIITAARDRRLWPPQLPDQTLFICPSMSPRMVAMGSALAAKIGGRRRSSCQLSLRSTWRR